MRLLKRPEITGSASFMIVGILWIILSDRFFLAIQHNLSSLEITKIQTIKGTVFILVVTLVIYFLIKSAHQQLFKLQKEYKDLFFNTPKPLLIVDPQTKKVCKVNRAALEAYGYSLEELSGMLIDDVRVKEHQKELSNHEKYDSHEHKKKDNTIITSEETKRETLFQNESASPESTREITELEKTKFELIERENQLQQILNSITDGFFLLTRDFKIKKANSLFTEIVEIPVDAVEGKYLSDLFPDINMHFLKAQYLEAMEKQKVIRLESFYPKKNAWYRLSAYPFDGGISVFFRDITIEKEEKLRSHQNEQNLISLINNTEDLIWSINSNFKYFTFNEPYRIAYKKFCKEDVWVGKTAVNAAQGDEHVNKWKGLYERALAGEKFSVDMEFETDEKPIFTTLRFNPICNAEEKVIGVSCFLQNITERKLYESRIEQQNDKLKQIAFITSHKVRAPLANILGLVDVLDHENPLDPSNSKIIEHLKTSAQELDKTIIDMVQETAQLTE